ncbi:hypothetical protein [Niallia sp. Krafla_26]
MTNIIDGMDAARFNSPGTDRKKQHEKDTKEHIKKMPTVLQNLKNGS